MKQDYLPPDGFKQFIDSEMMDKETYDLIYSFVELDNFRHGEYEGNEYVIRKMNRNYVQLESEVATENTGRPEVDVYGTGQFLALLRENEPEW